MKNLILSFALIISFFSISFSQPHTLKFSAAQDWDKCLYDWKIDVTSSPNEVKLLKTELIADEMGTTTQNMGEEIIGKTWIKKEFLLDKVEADKAVLLYHCNLNDMADLQKSTDLSLIVDVNGHAIKLSIDVSRMLTGGWVRCDVPVEYLKVGLNTVILRNETNFKFKISIEASRIPNRSAKSIDGGKTWDYDHLGKNDYIDGEYLMRLRLSRYPANAEIKSDYIETASLIASDAIKPDIKLKKLSIVLKNQLPKGTAMSLQVRGGKSPAYNSETWTPWQEIAQLNPETLAGWKFFQWRVELKTGDHRVTPVLQGVSISADIDITNQPNKNLQIQSDENQKIIRGYYNFAYQEYDLPRLEMLRKEYCLDEVIYGASTQFQAIRTLAFWLRGSWRDGWNRYYGAMLHTPWDAFVALEMVPHGKASGMCTIYSTTFIQCALSLGFNARGMVLDHHFISEVWMDELKKWVTIDIAATTTSLRSSYYEKDGQPLNSLEMHRETQAGNNDKIWIVPAGGQYDKLPSVDEIGKDGMLGALCWKPRFGIPLRNNFLTSLMPGELEHGFMQYHYDGFLWWKDTPVPVYEEYTYQSSHPRDFYWTLNQTQIFFNATQSPDELNVTLDTVTPNFDKFLVRMNDAEWKEPGSEFTWKLHSGENTISVKSVNKFKRDGIVSKIIIKN